MSRIFCIALWGSNVADPRRDRGRDILCPPSTLDRVVSKMKTRTHSVDAERPCVKSINGEIGGSTGGNSQDYCGRSSSEAC